MALEASTIVALTLFFSLLCACIIVGHLLRENRWMNESINALIIGLLAGVVVLVVKRGKSSHILVFSEELFFIYLLPPIIFNAGFQVKKKQFFRNFLTILMFGAIGTFISFCIITIGSYFLFRMIVTTTLTSRDYLAIGAIFSATDSVCTLQVLNQDETPLLYSLVFGEGVVNDATSIVLFNAVTKLDFSSIDGATALRLLGNFFYLFFTSTILGIAAGLLSAYIIKTLYFGRHSTDREVAIMMLMAYLSYMLAELFDLSGIMTVFFCGIVMSHYTWHNVTESSRVTTNAGVSASISGTLLMLVLVARAAFVYPLSFIRNKMRRKETATLEIRQQFIIWWAGLMRGAVTMALSYNHFTTSGSTSVPSNALMITSTIIVVLFSTVVFGLVTKPLIRILLLHPQRTQQASTADETTSFEDLRRLFLEDGEDPDMNRGRLSKRSSLRLLLQAPTSTVHYFWRKFDDGYMRPLFGGRGFVPFVPGSPTGEGEENQEIA
ncbi:sodium/hydrogen exchanger 2-like isoform X2 [Nymphaea colorata]|uniref:sodium/hydrogen exchanger 2-like isoform X2 n=1 Tax=Nymphaea colorata TaxID=210225 RepID=UPI00129EEA81|nr:sodium/hydrogen exchanger 2-like isoform X2 [Nymphaea colorata]